ncbi:8968_t:CDS:1 [Funneliformis mosseae]|uniref:8968_t:CDS:1 n=1 Tax=Funneliformis mosseae TaxID=27381 RepID=A0A9N9E0P6_FUNMO|nr:8968_t:CDS:1 [Funneliformis mosseae]
MLEDLSILCKKRSEEIGLQLLEITCKYLQGKTQKAVKIYNLFEKVGVDKIKYITTYTANAISELINDKFQEIINNFSKQNPKELHHMSSKDESSIPKISKKILLEVNASTTPMSAKEVSIKHLNSNSSDNSSKIGLVAVSTLSVSQVRSSKKSRLLISILPNDPEEKQKHIIELVLKQFSYLYLSDSDEYSERFNLNSSTLYLLCNRDHKEESI